MRHNRARRHNRRPARRRICLHPRRSLPCSRICWPCRHRRRCSVPGTGHTPACRRSRRRSVRTPRRPGRRCAWCSHTRWPRRCHHRSGLRGRRRTARSRRSRSRSCRSSCRAPRRSVRHRFRCRTCFRHRHRRPRRARLGTCHSRGRSARSHRVAGRSWRRGSRTWPPCSGTGRPHIRSWRSRIGCNRPCRHSRPARCHRRCRAPDTWLRCTCTHRRDTRIAGSRSCHTRACHRSRHPAGRTNRRRRRSSACNRGSRWGLPHHRPLRALHPRSRRWQGARSRRRACWRRRVRANGSPLEHSRPGRGQLPGWYSRSRCWRSSVSVRQVGFSSWRTNAAA